MTTQLLDEASLLLTPELQARVAARFQVPVSGVYKAASAAMPPVLLAIAERRTDGPFMSTLLAMITHPATLAPASDAATTVLAAFDGADESPLLDQGRALTALLFGERAEVMAGIVGRLAGCGPCGTTLQAAVAAGALYMLGHVMRRDALDGTALAAVLGQQEGRFRAAISAPMAGVLGIVLEKRNTPVPDDRPRSAGSTAGGHRAGQHADTRPSFASTMRESEPARPTLSERLVPVLAGLAAIALIALLLLTR